MNWQAENLSFLRFQNFQKILRGYKNPEKFLGLQKSQKLKKNNQKVGEFSRENTK